MEYMWSLVSGHVVIFEINLINLYSNDFLLGPFIIQKIKSNHFTNNIISYNALL